MTMSEPTADELMKSWTDKGCHVGVITSPVPGESHRCLVVIQVSSRREFVLAGDRLSLRLVVPEDAIFDTAASDARLAGAHAEQFPVCLLIRAKTFSAVFSGPMP